MKLKKLAVAIVALLTISSNVFAITFTDIDASHWAYNNVMTLAENGVINGYEDNTFRPDGTISRGEFLKLVIVAAKPEWMDINRMSSALDHWAGKYLYIAETYGVVPAGSITAENINKPITRIEMAMMISKADISLKGAKISASDSIGFGDTHLLAKDELKWLTHAVNSGLIKGYEDNTFKPDNNMKRSEAATMIYRFTGQEG